MFEKVIVLGCGKAALECAGILIKKGIAPQMHCVGSATGPAIARVKRLLGDKASESFFVDKTYLTELLTAERQRTLLVSAANYYVIPKTVLEKENIVAVNFHNACLPMHPGRNAEAWSVFNQDAFSGITWHYVIPQVDKGDILYQERIELTASTTSFSLLREQNNLAVKSFGGFVGDLLTERIRPWAQAEIEGVKMHYSWERPNDGVLDLKWDSEKISAFLRCYDYGVFYTLGYPTVEIDGCCYRWQGYKISQEEHARNSVEIHDGVIRIQRGTTVFHLSDIMSGKE